MTYDDFDCYRRMAEGATVREAGQFHGEPRWVPEFWHYAQGMTCDDQGVSLVQVDSVDVESYPELAGWGYAELWENYDGTVQARLGRFCLG